MTGFNLRLLEARFRALEAREAALNQRMGNEKKHPHRNNKLSSLNDPLLERNSHYVAQRTVPMTAPEEAAGFVKREGKKDAAVREAADAHHSDVAVRAATVKQEALHFLNQYRQQSANLSNLRHHEEEGDAFLTGVSIRATLHTPTMAEEEGAPLDPLFQPQLWGKRRTADKPPQGAPKDDEEDANQAEIVEQLQCSDAQLHQGSAERNRTVAGAGARVACNRPGTAPTTSLQRRLSARGEPTNSSVVPDQGTPPPPKRLDDAQRRVVQSFFNALPPVIPPKAGWDRPQRVARPTSAPHADQPAPRVPSPPVARAPTGVVGKSAGNRPNTAGVTTTTTAIPRYALNDAFYLLRIKVVHPLGAPMHDWIFMLVVTDVTRPNAQPTHSVRNLRLSQDNFLLLSPPTGTGWNPLHANIAWVAGYRSLYGHKLRLEVFVTEPLQTKVVDTMVQYGTAST